MKRILYFAFLLVLSWCVMTCTHETGHLVGGWMSGATLKTAELRPWRMPYSMFAPDPHPLVTLWCGPLLGVVVPLAIAWPLRRDGAWFVAHFCVLANGIYLATAWISGDRFLDTPKLLEHGASPISIAVYCLVTIAFGYAGFRRECVRLLKADSQDVCFSLRRDLPVQQDS